MDVLTSEHIQNTLTTLGVDTEITFYGESTATSQQAADQIGCELGQIAKSLCFMVNKEPLLVIASVLIKKFGSFDNSLLKAEIDPNTIRESYVLKKEVLVDILKKLKELEIPINYKNFVLDENGKIKAALQDHFQLNIEPVSLIRHFKREFIRYDEALRAAGFNPYDIRIQRAHAAFADLTHIPHQKERITNPDGTVRTVVLLGEAAISPEQSLLENEFSELIAEALSELKYDNLALAKSIVELLLAENWNDFDDLLQLCRNKIDPNIEGTQIKEIFFQLSQNEKLRDLL